MIKKKSFNFGDYDLIGFSLDHTLVRYNFNSLIRAQYDFLVQFLVKTKFYPTEYFSPITDSDRDFVCRGTFIDMLKGNFLQVDNVCQIIKATAGTRQLTEQEIVKAYGKKRIFRPTVDYVDAHMKHYKIASWPKIQCYTDYSQCAAVLVFAKAVDHKRAHKLKKKLHLKTLWLDIEDGLNQMAKNGDLDDSIPNFVFKTDPKIVSWLAELRKTSALMLVTGCSQSAADLRMRFAFSSKWKDMFDFVIYNVNRFEFFRGNANFVDMEGKATSFTEEGEYTQGSIDAIEENLKNELKRVPKILYAGGGSLHDILAPRCDVLGVVGELSENAHFPDCDRSENSGWLLSKTWGHFDGEEDILTIWGRAIEEKTRYSCPTLSYFSTQPPGREYRPHWLESLDRRSIRERAIEMIKEKSSKKYAECPNQNLNTGSVNDITKSEYSRNGKTSPIDFPRENEIKAMRDKDKNEEQMSTIIRTDVEHSESTGRIENGRTIGEVIRTNKQTKQSSTDLPSTSKRGWW